MVKKKSIDNIRIIGFFFIYYTGFWTCMIHGVYFLKTCMQYITWRHKLTIVWYDKKYHFNKCERNLVFQDWKCDKLFLSGDIINKGDKNNAPLNSFMWSPTYGAFMQDKFNIMQHKNVQIRLIHVSMQQNLLCMLLT